MALNAGGPRVQRALNVSGVPRETRTKEQIDREMSEAVHAQLAESGVTEAFVGPVMPGSVALAFSLRRFAEKPLPAVKRGRGRPAAGAVPPPSLSRQERRNRERLAVKAAEAWHKATDGAGVVLVDGKPVPVKGVKS